MRMSVPRNSPIAIKPATLYMRIRLIDGASIQHLGYDLGLGM